MATETMTPEESNADLATLENELWESDAASALTNRAARALAKLRAENGASAAALAQLWARLGAVDQIEATRKAGELAKLRAENERLRAALREVIECAGNLNMPLGRSAGIARKALASCEPARPGSDASGLATQMEG